ncbi:MAG: TlpA family protein disulfide reductase [Acidobacteria bacterium]|nr:TlpA family protein disulfide reductase [Acidobacteriota bacterium]
MKKNLIGAFRVLVCGVLSGSLLAAGAAAQTKPRPKTSPKPKTKIIKLPPREVVSEVTQIDEAGLRAAVKPNGKPLLVNFWATWCDPCREEFPDLVKIDADYKGRIDFITVSLDDLAEINRDVPKFLAAMNAPMRAYLLKVEDEGAAIAAITKDWQGGLPFTILYNEKGEIAYFRQGKIKIDVLRGELDKLVTTASK